MSKQAKTVHPMARAVLAITALGVIVVSANLLISSLGVGHKNADFTADKVHTLSDGTRGILKDLGAPVTIRYYATRSSDYMPEDLKLHMRRVDDLLAEYQNLSGGKLRVEQLDPQPDTDAEDAANLDGIRGQRMDDQNLYFGLAVSCIDRTSTIPFIDPSQETMLEYEISKAISEVSRATKPVIGLMSGLPIAGEPQNPMAMMQGQQGSQPWVFYSQLAQSYEVKDLTMTPAKIDPEIDVLLVFHPAGITPEAEFAIDQYVLQGGTVVACLDPMSVAAQMSGGGNPMMGGGGAPTASNLPTLLGAWGVSMGTQVVGDPNYQTTMSGNRPALAVLTVPQEGMPQRDKDVITKNLSSLTFFLPGGFTKTGGAGVAINSLVKSSAKAGLVDATKASQLDPTLSRTIKDPKSYDLVMHLKGNFKTAFPKGKPGEEATGTRLSLLTGLNRKEIRRLTEGETKPVELEGITSFAAAIHAVWISQRRFRDKNGMPRVLPRHSRDRGPSFDELVRNITTDHRPAALLEELVRLELVDIDAEGNVTLRTHPFLSRTSFKDRLLPLAENLEDHAEAAVTNVLAQEPPFLERSVFSDELTEESAARLHEFARQGWRQVHDELIAQAIACEKQDKEGGKTGKSRIRMGMYFYSQTKD